MMRIQSFILVFTSIFTVLSNDQVQLYKIPGSDLQAEFQNDAAHNEYEDHVKQFEVLPQYKKLKFTDINLEDKMAGAQITQQLTKQASDRGAVEFFKKPDLSEQHYLQQEHINLERFYDYETDSYMQNFKTPQIRDSMKKIHEDYYNMQEEQRHSPDTFLQTYQKELLPRPKELPTDFKSSFMTIQNTNKIFPILHLWQRLNQNNCWASSRYEFAFIYILYYYLPAIKWKWGIPYLWFKRHSRKLVWRIFTGYPCASNTGNLWWWFWFSEIIPLSHQQQEIVFRLEFDTVSRLRYIGVWFMIPPREIKIETSQDKQFWETAKDWQSSPDWVINWYYFWSRFDPMLFTRSLKLVLRGYRKSFYGKRHGMWHIACYSQQQTVMLMQKSSEDKPMCMARAEASYNIRNQPHILMSCFDATLQNDGREIYFLDELLIKQWADWSCVVPQEPQGSQAQYIVSELCKKEDAQEWVIDRLGKVQSRKYSEKCMAAKEDDKVSRFEQYGIVSVSSAISDSRSNPYNVIDPNGYGWWAPPLDNSHAHIQVLFEKVYTLSKLVVQWKIKPPKAEVMLLTKTGQWKVMLTESPQDDIEMILPPTDIRGVKVLLMDMDIFNSDKPGEAPVYGIKKIQLFRPGKALLLDSCSAQGEDSKIMNRFKLEQAEYINISYNVPYQMANDYMEKQYAASVDSIREFMKKLPQFNEIIDRAQKIQKVLDNLKGKFEMMSQQLMDMTREMQKNSEGEGDGEAKSGSYAGSPERAAYDCQKIREYQDYKRNGYYWVKNKCMPSAERVYCDMDSNFPNFYVYKGFKKNKQAILEGANTQEGIKKACGELGLEPVQISSPAIYENIVEYLEEAEANSENEYGIPIAYKWSMGPFSKFKSFNSSGSADLDDKLKSHIFSSPLKGLLGGQYNALVLLNSKDKVEAVNLKSTKIRGVVCSENRQTGKQDSGYLPATCSTTLDNLKQNAKPGQVLKVSCPKGCSSGGTVQKSQLHVFSSESAICRAGIFVGAAKLEESTIFQIQVIKTEDFRPQQGEANGVTLNEDKKVVIKGYKIVSKAIEDECPNLAQDKKSFISFDEIMKKIETQRKETGSFMQTKEGNALEQERKKKKKKKDKKKNDKKDDKKEEEEDEEEEEDNDEDGGDDGGSKTQASSQQAVGEIKNQLKKKLAVSEQYIKYINESKKLIETANRDIQNVYSSNLNPKLQSNQVNMLDKSLQSISTETKRVMEVATNQLNKAEENLILEIEQFLKLKRFAPFNEKYKFMRKINTLYDIKDHNDLALESSWKYTTDNTAPHKFAILQESRVSCNDDLVKPKSECTATQLEIKYKVMYDFKVYISFKALDFSQGWVGVIFRKKDDFNYYSLDINQKWVRFRKMINGQPSIINMVPQESKLLSNVWYNVELVVKQNIFTVKLILEGQDGSNKISEAKIVLKTEDLYLKSGTIGLTTDKTSNVMFDAFSAVQMPCFQDPFDPSIEPKYSVQTNRFYEFYQNDINLVWQQPSNVQVPWVYKKNYNQKKTVMFFQSQQDKKGDLIELQGKFFDIGTIGFKFLIDFRLAKFKVKIFNVDGKNMKFVFSNEFVEIYINDGRSRYQLVKKKFDKQLKINVWHSFYISATQTKINLHQVDDEKKELVDIFDPPLDRESSLQRGTIQFKPLIGSIAIDSFLVDMLDVHKIFNIKKEEEQQETEVIDVINEDDDIQESQQETQTIVKKAARPVVLYDELKLDYEQCLTTPKPEERLLYCKQHYPGMEESAERCQKNFCTFCCGDKIPGTMVAENKQCQKECNAKEEPSDSVDFTQCLSPSDAEHAYGLFCEKTYQLDKESFSKQYCQLDLCESCCVTIPLVNQISVQTKTIKECMDQCQIKFPTN